MKKTIVLLMMCLPLVIMAQGINWTTGLSWPQIKAKAKKENKYIFVDAYTTWCKPCKEMDMKVYTVDSVAAFLNKGFISVKLQMDQTKNDDAAVKSWYKTASSFTSNFNIAAFPTMLFFTPSGEVATKEVGYKDPGSLIRAARNAQDPSKQYYVLLKNYKKGKLDDAAKRSLINTAKALDDTVNYKTLRSSYFAYLHSLPKEKLYSKENIEFIASVISRRNQVVFDMFYPDGAAVDKVMQKKGYAQDVVDDVIMKEKLAAVMNAALESKIAPDWSSLFKSIAVDYNEEYADRNILTVQTIWYYQNGNMEKYARSMNDKIERYGSDTTRNGEDFKLNNAAFLMWEKVNDVKELKRIIGWMKGVVRRGEKATDYYLEYWPLYLDTYANLLHKVGETKEALKWQELATIKSKELKISKGDIELLQYNFERMKKGEPTWPVVAN